MKINHARPLHRVCDACVEVVHGCAQAFRDTERRKICFKKKGWSPCSAIGLLFFVSERCGKVVPNCVYKLPIDRNVSAL
jgi:hypothetical protein